MIEFSENIKTVNSCLYTVITGGYEGLNELEGAAEESKIKKICFTDNKNLTSATWEIVIIDPPFPMDSVRSQRMIKTLAHKYLPDFDYSLYIDNTVRLICDPFELINKFCSSGNISIPIHSFRDTVMDEFYAVAEAGLDEGGRITEQMNHYFIMDREHFQERPYWTGIIVRKHSDPEVKCLMEEWCANIIRYSRRDQLSLNFIEKKTGVEINKIFINNLESKYHVWPVHTSRKNEIREHSPVTSGTLLLMNNIKNTGCNSSDGDTQSSASAQDNNIKEKPECVPAGFNGELYLLLNRDVAEAGIDPEHHFIEYGWREGRKWK